MIKSNKNKSTQESRDNQINDQSNYIRLIEINYSNILEIITKYYTTLKILEN